MNVGDRVTIVNGGFSGLAGVVLKLRNSVEDEACICLECDEWCDLQVKDNSGVWSGSFCFNELEVQKWEIQADFDTREDAEKAEAALSVRKLPALRSMHQASEGTGQVTQFEYINATVGCHDCTCLDCFDQYVGGIGEVCGKCEEAGCEPLYYCQREDLYEI